MKFVDTHTHLYDEAFDADYAEALERARQAGVTTLIYPGIDSKVHDRMVEKCALSRGMAHYAVGVHPTSVDSDCMRELMFVEDILMRNRNEICAIGEIGLDCYWSREFLEQQKEIFYRQMILASQYDLPVLIHIRDAYDVLFEVLDRLKKEKVVNRGIFHAFSGSLETYTRLKHYGNWLFGIGGVVTYRKASIAQTLTHIPLTDLVLETDSPWLTPVPHRGKRNEPSYIPYIASRIAEIKEIGIEEVAATTTENAIKLFNI